MEKIQTRKGVEMKRIIFLVIASLLVIAFVLPSCAGDGGNGGEEFDQWITFAIVGPMTEYQGEYQWWGAEMARDEINSQTYSGAGGIDVELTPYGVKLIQVDTNEIYGTPEEGVAALEAVIDDVDFVVGGFQTEAVTAYREVAMDAHRIFMNCGNALASLQYSVVQDYDRYKYWFKIAAPNECFLTHSLFMMTSTIGMLLKQTLKEHGDAVAADYKVDESDKLKVALLVDDVQWDSGFGPYAQTALPNIGYSLVGTWQVSSTVTDISAELTEIAATKPHVIFTIFSGSLCILYSKQRTELGIPAMTIGYNLEGVLKEQWANTDGKCDGEIMVDTWAEDLQNTAKTKPFFDAFVAKTGKYPYYPATSYDAIYFLKEAIEAVSAAHSWDDIADVIDPGNIDALIQYLETSSYTGTTSKICYYPMPEVDLGDGVYALSEAQVGDLYDLASYGQIYTQSQWRCESPCGYGPHIAHDLVYGPDYRTAIGSQWQDGHKVGVWPCDLGDEWDALTDRWGCWNFEYPGTADVVIPIEGFLEL